MKKIMKFWLFWTNGIKKISFINFIRKIINFFCNVVSIIFKFNYCSIYTKFKQQYLKNSSIEFFPKLIQEKKFSNVMKNLTIFVEEKKIMEF